MDRMSGYAAAQDVFDRVVAQVAADGWDHATTCDAWTVRDIIGHVTWSQDSLAALAGQEEFTDKTGAPGAERPSAYIAGEPVATWRAARERAGARLNERTLQLPMPGRPGATVGSLVDILTFDTLTHAWDIAHSQGIAIDAPDELVSRAFDAARKIVVRKEGWFAPEVTAAAGDSRLVELVSFAGRRTA